MKKFILLLFVVFLLTGCGDKIHLGGKVTFPDGEPLGVGTVFFSNDNFLARAHLKANGSYDVGSLGQKDGLPAGTYKVFISGAMEAVMDTKDLATESFRLLIAPEFAAWETTPLTVTIPGERVYNITVERPAANP